MLQIFRPLKSFIQVFNYMRSYGVPYGQVTAGKSSVFLHYDRAEPLVLRQHLCVPAKEVTQGTTEISTSRVYHTLVAQLASFYLLSLSQQALTGRRLEAALDQTARHLKRWKTTDYKDPATSPESDDKDSPSASPPQDPDESFDCDESPAKGSYTLRPRACKDAAILPKRREDDEHGGTEGSRSRTTARASNRSKDAVGKGKNDKGSASAPTRQYCTQACLLSLKSGLELDKNCPNVRSHNGKGGTKHLIKVTSLVNLMAGQLRQDPYECCHALDGLGKRGSTGFVGKGTVKEYLSILKHECKIYQRLCGLQGEVVPVHLGIVSFARGYILPGGDRVVHMMLMSWGGLLAKEAVPSYLNLKEEVRRSSQAVYRNGVDHGDERAPNQLWNAERRRVMLIDFDRAALLPESQNKLLASLSTTGKKRKGDEARYDSGKRSLSRGLIQSRALHFIKKRAEIKFYPKLESERYMFVWADFMQLQSQSVMDTLNFGFGHLIRVKCPATQIPFVTVLATNGRWTDGDLVAFDCNARSGNRRHTLLIAERSATDAQKQDGDPDAPWHKAGVTISVGEDYVIAWDLIPLSEISVGALNCKVCKQDSAPDGAVRTPIATPSPRRDYARNMRQVLRKRRRNDMQKKIVKTVFKFAHKNACGKRLIPNLDRLHSPSMSM
ncbi:hypothetical protein BB8028_0009g01920 [Beauveria bassiana]|uniref:Uncharacterized protein n=1 Tax=Beauveria bassiana TaxID=176275 RepID=A0A2S7YPD2_BEABA|nr:hypothetical protein BB8028_0009g01920 [Beauveria bassiana]